MSARARSTRVGTGQSSTGSASEAGLSVPADSGCTVWLRLAAPPERATRSGPRLPDNSPRRGTPAPLGPRACDAGRLTPGEQPGRRSRDQRTIGDEPGPVSGQHVPVPGYQAINAGCCAPGRPDSSPARADQAAVRRQSDAVQAGDHQPRQRHEHHAYQPRVDAAHPTLQRFVEILSEERK